MSAAYNRPRFTPQQRYYIDSYYSRLQHFHNESLSRPPIHTFASNVNVIRMFTDAPTGFPAEVRAPEDAFEYHLHTFLTRLVNSLNGLPLSEREGVKTLLYDE